MAREGWRALWGVVEGVCGAGLCPKHGATEILRVDRCFSPTFRDSSRAFLFALPPDAA